VATDLFVRRGSLVTIHKEGKHVPCPCRTPEGFRDPEWHKANPEAPECNAAGFLVEPIIDEIYGFVQPAFTGRGNQRSLAQMFGEIQQDDHIGMFPLLSNDGTVMDFENWSRATDDYIEYNGMRFTVVGASLIPDPRLPQTDHHWEVALRRINKHDPGSGFGY
jgi:hypothetical protein